MKFALTACDFCESFVEKFKHLGAVLAKDELDEWGHRHQVAEIEFQTIDDLKKFLDNVGEEIVLTRAENYHGWHFDCLGDYEYVLEIYDTYRE